MNSEKIELTETNVTEVFEQLLSDYDTTKIEKKLETSRKVREEKHTVPFECEVGTVSTRAEVKFNK